MLACASVVGTASAAGAPGTAEFATPKRGTAVVVPGYTPDGRAYLPFAGGTRVFTVFARLASVPPGRLIRPLLKHQSTRVPCARSFAEDDGTAIPLAPTVMAKGGYVTTASKELRWRLLGKRRFCVWLTSSPRKRVAPQETVIEFLGRAIGAVMYPWRTSDGKPELVTAIAATEPFTLQSTSTLCPPDTAKEYAIDRAHPDGLYRYTGFDFPDPDCARQVTMSVPSSPIGAFAISSTIGVDGAGPLAHAGVCNLDPLPADPNEAEDLVERQGCEVGRTLQAPTSDDLTLPGQVWAYTVNGSEAPLVPTGTTVDLVVNRRG